MSLLGRLGLLKNVVVQSPNTISSQVTAPSRTREFESSAEAQEQKGNIPYQDSAYYSRNGAQEADTETNEDKRSQQLKARRRVEILRERVFRTRRTLRDRREGIRQLRENVRDAADKLTRVINEVVAIKKEDTPQSIVPYYELLRLAQDELGPKEDDYERLERLLEDEEQDLEDVEDDFYQMDDTSAGHIPGFTLDDILDPKLAEPISPQFKSYNPTEPDLEGSVPGSGLMQSYMEMVSKAEQLKRDLDELEDDFLRLSKECAYRQKYNVPVSAYTAKFFANYASSYSSTLEMLHTVEDDLFDLRDQCLKENLFTNLDHIYEPRDALVDDLMDIVCDARDASSLHVALQDIDPAELEANYEDKQDYVNKWILHWVQESVFQTARLRDYVDYAFAKSANMNEEWWSRQVVRHWDKDGAGNFTNKSYIASRMDTIAGDMQQSILSTGKRTGTSRSLTNFGELSIDSDEITERLNGLEFIPGRVS
ncbi:hypothetical protein B0O99DRAFT_597874 [Bisporella sp. PMI_857]|nr:hypothetical protein B0O99DRAFT_597874 [Bisporella sp. PMI_857]